MAELPKRPRICLVMGATRGLGEQASALLTGMGYTILRQLHCIPVASGVPLEQDSDDAGLLPAGRPPQLAPSKALTTHSLRSPSQSAGKAVALAYARQGARLVLVGAEKDKAQLEKVGCTTQRSMAQHSAAQRTPH